MNKLFLGKPNEAIKNFIWNKILHFKALDSQTTISLTYKLDMHLEYSVNNGPWTQDSEQGGNMTVTLNKDDVVYIRNMSNDILSNYDRFTFTASGGKIAGGGSIQYLLKKDGQTNKVFDRCYADMFRNCTALVTAPELPATELAIECYDSMFSGCTSLVEAPVLPATTTEQYCYFGMFSGCTSLVEAPELPATSLAYFCYDRMFSGCTSLVEAPELPATNASDYCYAEMFKNCSKLVKAPTKLPATSLEYHCYDSMFSGCTSLVEAPELPTSGQLDAHCCYSYMFENCTSLIKAPKLPATDLYMSWNCYDSMFLSCTSLTAAPELPATSITDECQQCYSNMFAYCPKFSEVHMKKEVEGIYDPAYNGDTTKTVIYDL